MLPIVRQHGPLLSKPAKDALVMCAIAGELASWCFVLRKCWLAPVSRSSSNHGGASKRNRTRSASAGEGGSGGVDTSNSSCITLMARLFCHFCAL